MYKKILLCLDNSKESDYAMEAALRIGVACGSEVTGCHVYAARLHETRFVQMEAGLPEQYQSETMLKRQREIHESLIGKGLNIIADSYLDKFEAAARDKGVVFKRRNREGKNYFELVREAAEGGYDLVVMGGLGKGAVEYSLIGGVCERVSRAVKTNILVVKTDSFNAGVMIGIDGSPSAYAALMSALTLKKVFGGEVTAMAAFDPFFHQVAFRNIAGALSEEAAKVFRFKEQEKLHDEIIDKGLAKLYQSHLDTAYKVAKARGVEIKTELLAGKAFNEMLKACQTATTSFVAVGRFGLHVVPESDIGNTAENLLRMAQANIFISAGQLHVDERTGGPAASALKWTEGAMKRLGNIPEFARGMAKKAIEDYASGKGCAEVTEEIVGEARKSFGM
ncbi:MAG: universal stress protein [Deltaproteobacteria bacterium]|nr:universal stress protein [Deltaproteobacteria bacterium]